MHCSSCTARSDGRSANGQFTAAVHKRARDAEAAGLQMVAYQLPPAEPLNTSNMAPMQCDDPIHNRVASDFRSLNELLAACAHKPLSKIEFYLFNNWLKVASMAPTVASVCAWENDHADDLPSLNAMLAADGRDPLDDADFLAFQSWIGSGKMHEESVGDWENSPEGQQWAAQRITEQCSCASRCTCTWRGNDLVDCCAVMIPGVTCDHYRSLNDLGNLLNYGSRPGEWQPGGSHVPENLDTDYLGLPDLTNFCTSCKRIRSEEFRLSHVEARSSGELFRVCDRLCQSCTHWDPLDEYDD